jgi:hypothetical protein
MQQTIAENRVVIFSKSYCPYCKSAKDLFATRFPDVSVEVLECVVFTLQHGRGSFRLGWRSRCDCCTNPALETSSFFFF